MRRITLAVGLAWLVACGGDTPISADRVELDEFTVETSGTAWRAGQIDLEVVNVGERTHTLVVTTEDGEVVTSTGLIDSGATDRLNVDLAPGSYQLTCRIVVEGQDGQIFDHFEQGMRETVTVTG